MLAAVLLTLGLVEVSAGCRRDSGGGSAPVPRPAAYPRQELAPPCYSPVDSLGLPLSFEANRAMTRITADTARRGASRWLTIDYPRLGAAIYLTFTRASSPQQAEEVAANRYERISRDMGRALWSVDAEAPAGEFTVYSTSEPVPTPAAAIMVADGGWVVSGSVALLDGAYVANPDSLAEARDYLLEDFWHGFQSVSPW